MPDAQELLQQIQLDLAPIEAQLQDHQYLQAIEQGQVPRDRLAVFVGEQHITIESDLRSLAALWPAPMLPGAVGCFCPCFPGRTRPSVLCTH